MTPRRCSVCEESDGDGRSGENRSERSFTGENGDGGGFSVLQCERGGAEGKMEWRGIQEGEEERLPASASSKGEAGAEWRRGGSGWLAERRRRPIGSNGRSGGEATPTSIGGGSSAE